jgi:hypothetical protein
MVSVPNYKNATYRYDFHAFQSSPLLGSLLVQSLCEEQSCSIEERIISKIDILKTLLDNEQ